MVSGADSGWSGLRSIDVERCATPTDPLHQPINLGEVYYLAAKAFSILAATTLVAQVKTFAEVVSVTDEDIDDAAKLKARFKISYADAFAAVLSVRRGVPVVTGDPEFRNLEAAGVITLHWIGA